MNINDHRTAFVEMYHERHTLNHCPHWTTGSLCEREADALLASPALARLLAAARDEARAEAAREARERGDIGHDGGPEVWDWLEGINRRAALARGEVA